MSMLQAKDGGDASYLEIGQALEEQVTRRWRRPA